MKVAKSDNRIAFKRCSGTWVPSETEKGNVIEILKKYPPITLMQ